MDATFVRDKLDRRTLENLRRLAWISGLYQAGMALYYTLTLPEDLAAVMQLLAILAGLFSFILAVALRAMPLSPRHAHAVLATPIVLGLLNSLVHAYLVEDAAPTVFTMLIAIVAGLAFLSSRWTAFILLIALTGWGLVARQALPREQWLPFGLGMVGAAVVAFTAQRFRRNIHAQLAHQRRREQQQRTMTQQATAQIQTVIALGQHLTARQDLDRTLTQVVTLLRDRYDASYVGVFLWDEREAELIARAGTGAAGRASLSNGTRIPIGRGVIGWVAQHHRAQYVSDTHRDARFRVWDLIPDTQSELTLPLMAYERFFGVLDMQSDRAHGFREEDIPLLQHLANQIALAVQNAQFYQTDRHRHRLAETFYNVGRALARPMDRQAMLDLILQQLVTIIPHDRGAILLQKGEALEMVAAHGFPGSKRVFQWRIPIKPGDVFDEIRRTQRPLVLADALQRRDWHHIDDLLPARSWMGVPLVHDDRVIGMLSLARETHVPYTEDEVTFAASFAGQAMIALENARLRDQVAEPQTRGVV